MLTRIVLKSPLQRNFSQKGPWARSEILCGDSQKTLSEASGRITGNPEPISSLVELVPRNALVFTDTVSLEIKVGYSQK